MGVMSTALDVVQTVGPLVTALGGAYYGARWQAKSASESELRVVVDEAVTALQQLARRMGNARSHYIADAAHTSDEGWKALGALDQTFFDAQDIRDRLLVRTAPEDPVAVHYLNALLAVGRGFQALKKAAYWPNA
jgi:hypothetical protein